MRRIAAICMFLAGMVPAEPAIVQRGYSFDAADGDFFTSDPMPVAVADAAALDLGDATASTLGAIATDFHVDTDGETTVTFDWRLSFDSDPAAASSTQSPFNAPINLFAVSVGMMPLIGNTLGVGGFAGAGFNLIEADSSSRQTAAVVPAQEASDEASDAVVPRGTDPVMGTISGSSTLSAATTDYSVKSGGMAGSRPLGNIPDDSAIPESPAHLAASWHRDHTAGVAATQSDFFLLALQERIPAVGLGTSDTWNTLKSATQWTGTQGITLAATGTNPVSADACHIANGAMCVTIGTMQLDLAFLRDFECIAESEPSSFMLWNQPLF